MGNEEPTAKIECSHTRIADIDSLIPNPKNPNTHPQRQIELLAKIILHQGWRSPIVVSKRSGFIVKGHGRLEAARHAGLQTAPVDDQEYETEAAEWADLIADNQLSELSEVDELRLGAIFQEVDFGEFDMELTGFDEAEIGAIAGEESETTDDSESAEALIDEADVLLQKWGVRPGQIWELGNHRIMCGDSTKEGDVKSLIGSSAPQIMVTDPPYGVEYDANWRNNANWNDGKAHQGRAVGKVLNDDKFDWRDSWAHFPGDIAYVWHAGVHSAAVSDSISASGFDIKSQIIWAKNNHVIGRGAYHWKHEPCWYAVRQKAKSQWAGDRSQTTVWEIPKPQKSETGHSTQKPVECMARPIRNHACHEVYEPFSGSGTTIIACEQLKRKCLAMELNPKYVAVAIQRWVDLTGKEPTIIKHP